MRRASTHAPNNPSIQPWPVRYAEGVLRWRWPIILVSVAVVALLASGVRRIDFNDDYRLFFGPENPQLVAFETLQNIYTKNDNILFAIAPQDGDVFRRETLAAIESLTQNAWQIPFCRRVDSLTNFQHLRADGDELIVRDLVEDALSLNDDELDKIKRVAFAEPLLRGRMVAASGDTTGLNVVLQLPGKSFDETQRAVDAARQLADEVMAEHPGLEIHLTGFAMLNNAFKEAAMRDMATLAPVMYGVIILFLALLFRSIYATFATLLVVGFSSAAAIGAAGWVNWVLTPPSTIAPTLILTLAVADSVHLLKGMFVRLAAGDSQRQALIEAIRLNLWPVFLTSATTTVGFLSMNFSDSPPFRDLGNLTAIGVTTAFIVSVTFLPAMVSLLPIAARRSAAEMRWTWITDLVEKRRRLVLVTMGLLVIGLGLAVPRNELNDQFVEYFDRSVPFRVDSDFAVDRLTGIYQIEYSLGAGSSGAISEPSYLEGLERFSAWWLEQPGVVHVRGLPETVKRLNRAMHGDQEVFYRLPASRELAAQYLLLYELSLPYGLDLNDELNIDKSASRFTVTLGRLSAKELIAAAERGEAWLRDHAPQIEVSHGVGPSLMFAYLTQRNIKSMLLGTFIALVMISFFLVLAFRSVRYGLLSLIPNLAPAVMAFGLWGLMVGQVNVGLSTVVAMTLGIVVDDSVHFFTKYLRGRREHGLDATAAVRFAFRSTGEALWTTSVVLTAGFCVVAFSSFDLNSSMGKLTAITIGLALVADFFLLPALLIELDREPARQVEEARCSTSSASN